MNILRSLLNVFSSADNDASVAAADEDEWLDEKPEVDYAEIVARHKKDPVVTEDVSEKLKRLQNKMDRLLPAETSARNRLRKEISELAKEARRVTGYTTLDTSFLGMVRRRRIVCSRDPFAFDLEKIAIEVKLPVFAFFPLDGNGTCVLGNQPTDVKISGYVLDSASGKHPFGTLYNKYFLKTSSDIGFHGLLATASLGDVAIPDSTRSRIDEALQHFDLSELFIIREAEWDVREVPVGDPLVVAVRDDIMYLIDVFDMTKAEDYVAREFKE